MLYRMGVSNWERCSHLWKLWPFQQLNDSTLITSVLRTHLFDRNQTVEDLLHFYPTIQYNDRGNIKEEVPNRYFLMYQEANYGDKSKQEVM